MSRSCGCSVDDVLIASDATELAEWESRRPAFLLSRSSSLSLSLSPALPHSLPELSTLLHTAGIRPINRQTTSCNARRRLTLHDRREEGPEGEKDCNIFWLKGVTVLVFFVVFFWISREGRPETERSGARVGGRKLLHRVSEAQK